MNLPNKLSLIRIASVPVITLLLALGGADWMGYAALFIFISATFRRYEYPNLNAAKTHIRATIIMPKNTAICNPSILTPPNNLFDD